MRWKFITNMRQRVKVMKRAPSEMDADVGARNPIKELRTRPIKITGHVFDRGRCRVCEPVPGARDGEDGVPLLH